jgi:hypothetical protein
LQVVVARLQILVLVVDQAAVAVQVVIVSFLDNLSLLQPIIP